MSLIKLALEKPPSNAEELLSRCAAPLIQKYAKDVVEVLQSTTVRRADTAEAQNGINSRVLSVGTLSAHKAKSVLHEIAQVLSKGKVRPKFDVSDKGPAHMKEFIAVGRTERLRLPSNDANSLLARGVRAANSHAGDRF